MAKRPLTPRECELVVCSPLRNGTHPVRGIMERLESITLRDIIGPSHVVNRRGSKLLTR